MTRRAFAAESERTDDSSASWLVGDRVTVDGRDAMLVGRLGEAWIIETSELVQFQIAGRWMLDRRFVVAESRLERS